MLQNKVISITGAASGMGRQLARLAARRGAQLALADVSAAPLAQLADELRAEGVAATATVVDVASRTAVDGWIGSTVSHFGRLDGAANLAGVVSGPRGQIIAALADLDDDEWQHILGVNLTGTMHCMRAQLRVMTAGASIVNAASVAGAVGRPNMSAYAASKHGVVGLTRSAAQEAGGRGIRVNCVAPGGIETAMLQSVHQAEQTHHGPLSTVPMRRPGQADEVAHAFAYLLGDESSYVSGIVLPVDGGLLA